ncbi:hypothetical protein ABHF54_03840 [Nitrosomonas europaea]|uniref:hypothetical protein n=1 Tax=Nitrosomonas europaea TaxID=915 RepID=UPI00326313AB
MAAASRAHVLLDLGISLKAAIQHGVSSLSYWRMARALVTQQAMSNDWLKSQGLVSIKTLWCKAQGYGPGVKSSWQPD